MKLLSAASLVLPLALSACMFDVDDPASPVCLQEEDDDEPALPTPDPIADPVTPIDEPDPLPPWDASEPFRAIHGGTFTGDIASSRDLDLETDLEFVYDDGGYNYVEVYALRSDGTRVMLSFGAFGEERFFQPGVGVRLRPGYALGFDVHSLGCEGPDSGIAQQGYAFADTPYDEEPCETSVDTEQDPENPDELVVTIAATFADDCDDVGEPPADGGEDLPDADGDGDGDIVPPGEDSPDPGAPDESGVTPLTATTTFRLSH